ncbi:MAG: Uncharacterised protein [Candidatus Poseidoniaceae archaeon]|nr:MAG: Uncharacterised protein [Candidatus Poseidoniaceae archaeon]
MSASKSSKNEPVSIQPWPRKPIRLEVIGRSQTNLSEPFRQSERNCTMSKWRWHLLVFNLHKKVRFSTRLPILIAEFVALNADSKNSVQSTCALLNNTMLLSNDWQKWLEISRSSKSERSILSMLQSDSKSNERCVSSMYSKRSMRTSRRSTSH